MQGILVNPFLAFCNAFIAASPVYLAAFKPLLAVRKQ